MPPMSYTQCLPMSLYVEALTYDIILCAHSRQLLYEKHEHRRDKQDGKSMAGLCYVRQ